MKDEGSNNLITVHCLLITVYLLFPFLSQLCQCAVGMLVKLFIGLAEMVAAFILLILHPVFYTASPAILEPLTGIALPGPGRFLSAELVLPGAVQHVGYIPFLDVAQFPVGFHEKITREDISVVFDDDVITACM